MDLADGFSDIFGDETALLLRHLCHSQIVSVMFSHQRQISTLMAELHADNLADEKRDIGVTFAEFPHVTLRHQDMHPQ